MLTHQAGYKGIYQKIADMYGQTAWSSSNNTAIWWAPNCDVLFFGPMENLGGNYAGIITTGAGSLSCLYHLQGPGDQWVYYNGVTSAWTLANVSDVSIQCLSGIH